VEGEYKLSIDSQIWRGPDEVIRSNPGGSVYYTCATHVLLTLDLVKVYEAAFLFPSVPEPPLPSSRHRGAPSEGAPSLPTPPSKHNVSLYGKCWTLRTVTAQQMLDTLRTGAVSG